MVLFWSIVHKENQEVLRCVALIFVLLPWLTGKVLSMERFQKRHNCQKWTAPEDVSRLPIPSHYFILKTVQFLDPSLSAIFTAPIIAG